MEEERGGKRSRGASVARAVTRWAHISPMLYYFENVNTNKRHGPVTNSSQRIIILGGREIMVKQNKMLKCSIMGNPHIASWPPSAAWSSDVLSSTSQQHCLLVRASGPGLTWPLSSPQTDTNLHLLGAYFRMYRRPKINKIHYEKMCICDNSALIFFHIQQISFNNISRWEGKLFDLDSHIYSVLRIISHKKWGNWGIPVPTVLSCGSRAAPQGASRPWHRAGFLGKRKPSGGWM